MEKIETSDKSMVVDGDELRITGKIGAIQKTLANSLAKSGLESFAEHHETFLRALPNSFVEKDVDHGSILGADFNEQELVGNICDPDLSSPGEDFVINGYDCDYAPTKEDTKPGIIWHNGSKFTQMSEAIQQSTSSLPPGKKIRIVILDTGYDPHTKGFEDCKAMINRDAARSFLQDEENNLGFDLDAIGDKEGKFFGQYGHGTGTLSVLTGLQIKQFGANGLYSLANDFEIIPLRVGETVIRFTTKSIVRAISYVLNELHTEENPVHIVTMSMGGLASHAFAQAVNALYEKGIFFVAAAGNNFRLLGNLLTTPRHLVYPARFNRVVAACGITFDFRPYQYDERRGKPKQQIMQGNFGPAKLMDTAVATFTPNIPFNYYIGKNVVRMSGGGTSAAAPQIALAAALYWRKYYQELKELEGYNSVEVLRQALFQSAESMTFHEWNYTRQEVLEYFGRGYLRINDMLKIEPKTLHVNAAPKDEITVLGALIDVLNPLERIHFTNLEAAGLRESFSSAALDFKREALQETFQQQQDLALELARLVQIHPELEIIMDNQSRQALPEMDKAILIKAINLHQDEVFPIPNLRKLWVRK